VVKTLGVQIRLRGALDFLFGDLLHALVAPLQVVQAQSIKFGFNTLHTSAGISTQEPNF